MYGFGRGTCFSDNITKACAPREPWNICWKRRLHGVPSCGSDRLNVRIREGHMLFWYGRCQQLTPPESRKMWSFRKKSKKNFMWFPSVVFLLFLAKFLGIFDFLALLSARSRRVLANREERIKKENFSAFFWPVEICEILVRLLIVKVNKLVYIITRRNRLGSGWDFNNF